MPLIFEMHQQNTRKNRGIRHLHSKYTGAVGGIVTTGTVQLVQELQGWVRSDFLFSLLAAADIGFLLTGPLHATFFTRDIPFLMSIHISFDSKKDGIVLHKETAKLS